MKEEKKLEKITENTLLKDLLDNKRVLPVLLKYGFPCIGCALARYEMDKLKIGEIADQYSINCEKLLEEVNSALK